MGTTLTTTRPASTADGVERLTRIVARRLSTGQSAEAVTVWLLSPATAETFGADATRIVVLLVTGIDVERSCPECGYTPSMPDEQVVGPCVPGAHDLALIPGVAA